MEELGTSPRDRLKLDMPATPSTEDPLGESLRAEHQLRNPQQRSFPSMGVTVLDPCWPVVSVSMDTLAVIETCNI